MYKVQQRKSVFFFITAEPNNSGVKSKIESFTQQFSLALRLTNAHCFIFTAQTTIQEQNSTRALFNT